MKSIFKKIFAVLIVLYTVFSLTNCQSLRSVFQEPVVSLHSAELTGISFIGAQFLCKVQVQNPNSFDIPFPETDWEFFINNNSFLKGTVKNNQRIRARSTTIVDVPVSFEYVQMFNSFRSLLGSRQTGYKVALGVKIPLPILGDKVWNFEHEGTLPVLQMPQVNRPSMRMENADINRAIINVTVNVQNPNPFPIPSPKITYDYQLNRNSFIKGTIENEGLLAASASTPVVFQLIVNYADLFRSFSAMRNLFEVPSLLILTCDLGIPVFSDILRFEVGGTLPLFR
ncbi:MAG: LEA type 2 family protein [Treponema sp.]|nr:LEA type 2 family protein [Treponema sp.]